ncbi:MAG: hypothetical protein IJ802_04780 [Kiritimatiellae bacterium]|nr:hypothetical protein [Kiritimatiellia bacterium]
MRRDDSPFDKRTFYTYGVFLFAICLACHYTRCSAFVLLVPFIFGSIFSHKGELLFFWLLLIPTLINGNAYLLPKSSIFALSQRVTLMGLGFLLMFRLMGRRKSSLVSPFLMLIPYILYMIIPSMGGWMPMISYLKLGLFLFSYLGMLGLANEIISDRRVDQRRVRAIMLVFAAYFVWGSLCLVPFPMISQVQPELLLMYREEGLEYKSLFVGMSMHSQAFGPIISMITMAVYYDMLFGVKRLHPLYLALLAPTPYLIYLTSSRTGMAVYILALASVSWFFMRSRGQGVTGQWRSRVTSAIMLTIIALALAVILLPGFQAGVARFALKYKGSSDKVTLSDLNTENVLYTRLGMMMSGLHNFKESPLIGNGFQVSKGMRRLEVTSWKQLLSAPVEKSVWITAILEEGGVFGMGLFLIFAIGASLLFMARRAYAPLAGLICFLFVNMGEFVFFSISATGGVCWAMIFILAALDSIRIRDYQAARRAAMVVQDIPIGYLSRSSV